MNRKLICASLAVLIPGMALGQAVTSYQCTFEQLQRRIEILSEPGVSVPCEVHYYKDSEMPGEQQVLWTASTEAGFCEARTEEFIAKLQSWGWACNAGAAMDSAQEPNAAVEAEPTPTTDAMGDDTETLAPAAE